MMIRGIYVVATETTRDVVWMPKKRRETIALERIAENDSSRYVRKVAIEKIQYAKTSVGFWHWYKSAAMTKAFS